MTFFLSCLVFGVTLLLLGLLGLEHDTHHDFGHAHDAHDADSEHHTHFEWAKLLSLRALASGLAMFGAFGGLLTSWGLWWWAAAPIAFVPGFISAYAVAWIVHRVSRLERNNMLELSNTLLAEAQVYIPIPGHKAGAGKVSLTLQGRTVELEALTPGRRLVTGERVVVMDIQGEVVEVVAIENNHKELQ